jgi:hypothetical protein
MRKKSALRAKAKNRIKIGVVATLLGLFISAVTYFAASSSGGYYILASGPMVYGTYNILKGLWEMMSA